MQAEIADYRASDGYLLRYRRWPACDPKQGIVVALHGIQSHSGWYEFTSRRLAEQGWEVLFLDRRGSGMNDAARGHAAHADRLINDVAQILRQVRADGANSSRPLALLGLSWGGRLAACVAARHPSLIDGLILLYPGIYSRVGPSLRQRLLLRLATTFEALDRTRPIPLDDPSLFTSDLRWQQFIRTDPLALKKATAGFFAAGVQLEAEAQAAAPRLTMPTLTLLAGEDRIIDNHGVRRWHSRLASPYATLESFAGARHTLEFEACREDAARSLVAWLERLVSATGEPGS